jgi:hypothetical protein
MTDPLLDDVKALLNKDFGDDRILKQICRACENDEVISNYERNYVRKLAEKHLGKKPEFVQTPSVEKKHVVPDVVIPEIQHIPQTQTFQMESPRISRSNSKNKKIFLGLGIVAIVVIIASIVSFSEITDRTNDNDDVLAPFLIETDLTSYNKKDLISINGVSDTSGTVILSIENQNNELVWTEQISLKSDGRFSTLTIAGGQGWESSGTYTIKVDNGVETKSSTFSFTT